MFAKLAVSMGFPMYEFVWKVLTSPVAALASGTSAEARPESATMREGNARKCGEKELKCYRGVAEKAVLLADMEKASKSVIRLFSVAPMMDGTC